MKLDLKLDSWIDFFVLRSTTTLERLNHCSDLVPDYEQFCQWTAAQMSRDCDVYTRWKFAFSDSYGGCLDKSR